MTKVSGFLSQDVEVTRKPSPDDDDTTTKFPPSWLPLMEKIMAWYDRQSYPVWSPFGWRKTRSNKKRNQEKTYLPAIRALWAALDAPTKATWSTSAAFCKRSGYQLFVKDTSYRMKNDLPFPAAPSIFHQLYGLRMQNWGGSGNVRLRRDNVNLTGEVTLSFNYKKVERTPTGGTAFKAEITLWYFEAGENKTETHTWTAPAGNVAWVSVSETYGTTGRKYFHQRIIFHLDSYDADVYFANFLVQDQTLAWTVDYNAAVLPEDDAQPWSKTGDVATIKIIGDRLYLEEVADSANEVEYTRTPAFSNAVGSSVKFRLKVEDGTEKDSGNDNYTYRVIHSDGTYKVEYLFYQNGIIIKHGGNYWKYHYDTRKFHTYTSYIRAGRLYFYVARTLAFRKKLTEAGGQEVLFGHYGRDDYPTKTRLSYLKYFQGRDAAPGEDIIREGWWFRAGEEWEVEELYRKEGWSFSPGYREPYFKVLVLT